MSIGPSARISRTPPTQLGLTHAYPVALLLIALSMLASHLVVTNKLDNEVGSASIINSSGMQRMLSQRLGLLAREIVASTNPRHTNELFGKFESAWDKFDFNHTILVRHVEQSVEDSSIKDIYGGPEGVDARSNKFIALTSEFMSVVNLVGNTSPQATALMLEIVTIARNGFLEELDEVVEHYEISSSIAIEEFAKLEEIILIIGLSLLLIEALFIFRPLANKSKAYQQELETSNTELAEFSFRISHDLRSPIASCRGMIEIAQDAIEEKDDELIVETVDRIGVAMKKIDSLIEDIICVTRSKVVDVDPELVDIRSLVTETLETLSDAKYFNNFVFDVTIEPGKTVKIQKLYLQQIVENLLSNAIKYSCGSGGVNSPRVSIALKQRNSSYELTIDDNGIGIPENCREKLFGMFMRFHPKIATGSGLGLYLTKQNALAIGGDLSYAPLSPGSRFIVNFKPA